MALEAARWQGGPDQQPEVTDPVPAAVNAGPSVPQFPSLSKEELELDPL